MSLYEQYRYASEFKIPDTMQAIIAAGTGFENVKVAQVPVPKPGPDQVLARVDAAGVCTSILKLVEQGDKHTYINGWDLAKNPVILGDEGAITLVKIGSNLQNKYKPGQRFGIQPAVAVPPINHRERYTNNAQNMNKCAVGYTLGGNLAQYILVQEEVFKGDCLLPLPEDEMAYFAISMAEPISCVYSAQERHYHLFKAGPHAQRQPKLGMLEGGVAVVIGAGAMGRMHAELALRFRPRVLIVSDLQQGRLDETQKTIGAKAASKGTKLMCVLPDILNKTVMEVSNGLGADDIVLAVGVKPVQQNALTLPF
jgi:threonine dehydrogenase-like Zn-dependent dehydrogenase